MSVTTTKHDLARKLVERHGRLYSEELGIDLGKGTAAPLFLWLCASLLYSTRISVDLATAAAKRLADEGWTTVDKMARSTWEQRARALNESGYARYDESTSRMLGEVCEHLQKVYGGDLRGVREQAERDPQEQRELLKEFKGIGEVGADIFFREVQLVWDEQAPFADARALRAASRLGLASDAQGLKWLVDKKELPRLVVALVRLESEDLYSDFE
ncbi:hypothetical protein Mal64_07590 [Pseudobythopirellula maris]|uniref:Endonuclease III n=1 Tax=Pseudobythopirellula maris TaxID=2527991 RepID=A0A5C5ZSZ3_9BACT|nr:hypothetical protein [Pseudobythopirellula maris]TWT90370.1 hypothetical protein Mal64_07590 [Pseudobythopirellula maris]